MNYFFSLLSDDGILVLPVDERNELLKIRRVCGDTFSTKTLSNVHFAPLQEIPAIEPDFDEGVTDPSSSSTTAGTSLTSSLSSESSLMMTFDGVQRGPRSRSNSSSRGLVRLPPVLWGPYKSRHRQ